MSLVKRDEISVRNSLLELETGDINFSFNLLPPPSRVVSRPSPSLSNACHAGQEKTGIRALTVHLTVNRNNSYLQTSPAA